jgi:LytS/YehU family sensor histidine kinase
MRGLVRRTLVRSLVIAAVIVGGWTLLGSFFLTQDVLLAQFRGRGEVAIDEVVLVGTITIVIWMLLTPPILFLTARGNGSRTRYVARLIAVVLGFAVLRAVIGAFAGQLIEPHPLGPGDFVAALAVQFHSNVTLASVIVIARALLDLGRTIREKERRALTLEARLTRAQLEQLRGQLQPHFLFNAINGIAALVHQDADRADEMLMELAALLRSTLDLGDRDTIPLRRELEIVNHYLRIQTMRFEDRLRIRRTVETAALDCEVPALLLQPLLENSLRHVVATRPIGGTIELDVTVAEGRLRLRVGDDGPGFDPAATKLGVGLSNVIARLEQLYRGDARIDFTRESYGFAVTIDIPAQGCR